MASRPNFVPSPSHQNHLAVPNFRMYEGSDSIANHPIQIHLPSPNTGVLPHGAPNGTTSAFVSIEMRLRTLEKRSSESDELTQKLVEDAQRSIKDIRNKLLARSQASKDLSDHVDALNDGLDSVTDGLDKANERIDTLFAECARQCVETVVRPVTASLKELLGTVVMPGSNSNFVINQVDNTGTPQSSRLTADREPEKPVEIGEQRHSLHDCDQLPTQIAKAASSGTENRDTTTPGATPEGGILAEGGRTAGGGVTIETSKSFPTRRRKNRTSVHSSSLRPWANRLRHR